MKLLSALILALLCCSCLSRTCVPVRALGESGEGVISRAEMERNPRQPVQLGREPDLRLMRVGQDYYLEGVRTRFSKSYDFPYASMVGLGFSDKHPDYVPVSGAERVTVWRRVAVRNGHYAGAVKGSAWVESLPAGAVPVMVVGYGDVLCDRNLCEHGPQHTDWHALYAYPLAAATALGIDLPCTIVGNTLIGIAVAWVEFRDLVGLSRRAGLKSADKIESTSETD